MPGTELFISWSGSRSLKIAEQTAKLLRGVFDGEKSALSVFLSGEIDKGTRWSEVIAEKLSACPLTILCITSENTCAPWIMFEAGALSTGKTESGRFERSRVCTVLFGVPAEKLPAPLSQFQATSFTADDFARLLEGIDNARPAERRLGPLERDNRLRKYWRDYELAVSDILKEPGADCQNNAVMGGIAEYFLARGDIPSEKWNDLFRSASREIRLMSHSEAGPFMNGNDTHLILPLIRDKGITIRVLILTPSEPRLQQIREVQEGLEKDSNLGRKIRDTVEAIRRVKIRLRKEAPGKEHLIQLRVVDRIMYSSVSIFDSSDAIITHYADRDEIGKNSPAFHLKPVSGGDRDLFSFYEEEFERYWRRAVPYELDARRSGFAYERRVRRETDKIRRVSRWLDNGGTLDMPSMLVIYPTYKCTGVGETGGPLCSNCLYRRHISDRHIAPDLLEATITQAMEAGVRRIEFSGGGEPLQYRHIDRLMGFLKKVKSSHSDVRFGLLTNCIHLDEKLRGKAVGLFSYIRVSFAEGLQGERNQEALDLFRQNLGALLERQKDKDGCPRIGLKLLANKPNTQRRDGEPSRLMRDILELRSHIGGAFSKLDHIRIKAMRSSRADEYEIGEDDALRFRDEFWDHVFMTPKDHWPDDTQVDLDLRYTDAGAHSSSAGFICKLNPLVAVLDPDGKLFPCWNAVGNTAAIRQLDMADAGLKETWGDAEHKDVVRKMSVKDVCNSTSGCPCRFVEYHRIVDSEAIPCEPTIPEALNGFL